jgi:hypothetical protein
MAVTPDANLARFADHAGFRYDLLLSNGHRIENAPADFDGRVEAIRLTDYGRFGNVFYQTLHAVALARLLGCHTVFAAPPTIGPPEPALQVEHLRIVFRVEPGMDRIVVPTLTGPCFDAQPFESALWPMPPAYACEIVQRYLTPIFHHIVQRIAPVGDRTLVMNFRAGDIFQDGWVHPLYVQPPASYYLQCLDFARARLDVTDVRLVFEDNGNPAIACVKAHLDSQAFPYAIQSADTVEDLACLAGASHLVSPYSTFAEAAAMLSRDLKTYFAFRNFESHQYRHLRQAPLLLGMLRHKGVQAVLIDDIGGGFTPPKSWQRSPAQLRLIADYPTENLRILEGEEADARERRDAAADAPRQSMAYQQEADRLRDLLLASRQQAMLAQLRLDEMQRRLTDLDHAFRVSTSWRVTAPLRWLSRMRGKVGIGR